MVDRTRFGAKRVNNIYRQGMLENETPDFPVSYEDLRKKAHEEMSEEGVAYVHGGAGSEKTFEQNKNFSSWRIMPRMLRGVEKRDMSINLCGIDLEYPIILTPLGVQSLLHEEAEKGTAKGGSRLDVPVCLSSLSSTKMEEVAEILGDTPKFFQFYWSSNDSIAKSFLSRAEKSGYDAIVVTIDAPILGWRERLIETGYYPFLEGEGIANYFSDPEFRSKLDKPPEEDVKAAVEYFLEIFGDPSLTWEDLQFIYDNTSLPVFVKGILHPEDARLAIKHGADGIGVSNHGGRQIDGSITSLEALPSIVEEVNGEVSITFDSGIRRGSNIFKSIALGADAVMLGRPYAYGLAIDGGNGVYTVLKNILAEFDLTMGLSGCSSIDEIDREFVRHKSELYNNK